MSWALTRDFLFSPEAAGWWCMCAKDWNLLYNCECIPSDIWLLVGPAYKCWCYHILLLDSTACRTGLPLDRPSDTGASGTGHAIGPFAWWDTSLRFQRTKNILVTILLSFFSCVQEQNHNPDSHHNAVYIHKPTVLGHFTWLLSYCYKLLTYVFIQYLPQ